jgi:hypothetical protein
MNANTFLSLVNSPMQTKINIKQIRINAKIAQHCTAINQVGRSHNLNATILRESKYSHPSTYLLPNVYNLFFLF